MELSASLESISNDEVLNYQDKIERAQSRKTKTREFLSGLEKSDSEKLDTEFHQAHHQVFKKIDCLSCANCCKTTSPIFLMSDIERLSKAMGITVKDFMIKYLTMDEEDDFVLTSSPCPFLAEDNACLVYEHRPQACREYPHTNRKNIKEILDLTYHNSLVCPAVGDIIDRLQTLSNE